MATRRTRIVGQKVGRENARLITLQSAPLDLDESSSDRPTRDLSKLLGCHLCGGFGIILGIIAAPDVVPCGCTSGLRVVCAAPEGEFPITFRRAARLVDHLGLAEVTA